MASKDKKTFEAWAANAKGRIEYRKKVNNYIPRETIPRCKEVKKARLISRYRFRNVLPDIPSDARPLDVIAQDEGQEGGSEKSAALHAFMATPLESLNAVSFLASNEGGGNGIDLVDAEAYRYAGPEDRISDADARVIGYKDLVRQRAADDMAASASGGAAGGSAAGAGVPATASHHISIGSGPISAAAAARAMGERGRNVTWLRKAVYLHNDLWDSTYKVEESVAARTHAEDDDTDSDHGAEMDGTVDEQIVRIEESFAKAAKCIQPGQEHPTRKGVTAVEVLPVLPDLDRWHLNVAVANFTRNPAPGSAERSNPRDGNPQVLHVLDDVPAQNKKKGKFAGQDDIYFAHLHPRRGTKRPRNEGEPDGMSVTDYQYTGEYVVQKRTGLDTHTHISLAIEDGRVLYRPVNMKLALIKKKIPRYARPARVTVRSDPEFVKKVLAAAERFKRTGEAPDPVEDIIDDGLDDEDFGGAFGNDNEDGEDNDAVDNDAIGNDNDDDNDNNSNDNAPSDNDAEDANKKN